MTSGTRMMPATDAMSRRKLKLRFITSSARSTTAIGAELGARCAKKSTTRLSGRGLLACSLLG
jgi:hypothetical protein